MRLAIGTAQFGSAYGVANRGGRVPPTEVGRVLEIAREHKIDTLDTAIAYGESETLLGKIGVNDWNIITKIPPLPDVCLDVRAWILQEVHNSLKRLRISRLSGVLLHRAEDILGDRHKEVSLALDAIKEQGLADKVGFSIYSPNLLPELLKVHHPDMVQAPLNILDQRLVATGWLDRLNSADIIVHARSVFLQGLLLMQPSNMPTYFKQWNDLWTRWLDFVDANGKDPLAICLGFVRAQAGVSRIVVGVDSEAQFRELLIAYHSPVIGDAAILSSSDPVLLEPYNWKS